MRRTFLYRIALAVDFTLAESNRLDAAAGFPDVRREMAHYLFTLDVDAVFTDNPDRFPRDEPSR